MAYEVRHLMRSSSRRGGIVLWGYRKAFRGKTWSGNWWLGWGDRVELQNWVHGALARAPLEI